MQETETTKLNGAWHETSSDASQFTESSNPSEEITQEAPAKEESEDKATTEEVVAAKKEPKKKTPSEAGMINTVEHVQELADRLQLFDEYDPSNPLLPAAHIKTMHDTAYDLVTAVDKNDKDNKQAIYARHFLFENLPALGTRILNAVEACGADLNTVHNVRMYVRKLQGNRAIPVVVTDLTVLHSVSQKGYVNQADHLKNIILILKTIALYNPNVNALKIVTLESLLASLLAANALVNSTEAVTDMARTERNIYFNEPRTGLVAVCQLAKKEVKATYGAKSPQYLMISGLEFRKIYS